MVYKIKKITAREILDSRGNPTLETKVVLDSGVKAIFAVPSGASVGKFEAVELRDGNKKRYGGKGVKKAVKNVNKTINKLLKGVDVTKQSKIDRMMIVADGTPNKSKLGANAIVGVSLAVARAASLVLDLPLYQYIRRAFRLNYGDYTLPMPLVNVFNGGKHADTNFDIQELWVIPFGFEKFKERVRVASEIFHKMKKVLQTASLDSNLGDEGGYAPDLNSNEQGLKLVAESVKKAGYELGKDVAIGMDVAASNFFQAQDKKYILALDKKSYSAREMVDLYSSWIDKYKIIAIEDGLEEDDWQGWTYLTREFKGKIALIGDDLFVTNVGRLKKGIKKGVANAILIKPNQVGTLTETIQAVKLAQANKYQIAISHRSGETVDTFIADLAVAVNAEYIKTGSVARSERTAKYNRLMEIEDELGL